MPDAKQHRQRAEHRRQRRHQDRPEAEKRGLEDRLLRRLAVLALGFEGEVDDHDRVLLDDADQQHDADDADHVEILAGDHQREQRADAGRGQRRKDRHRMDVAFVQHAQHDIDGDKRRDQQEHLARKRILESLRRTLEAMLVIDGGRCTDEIALVDLVDRRAERGVLGQVERYGDRGELRQMADHERRLLDLDVGNGGKRHLACGCSSGSADRAIPSACRLGRRSRLATRITRYCVDWLKIVVTMRWPSAS